MVFVPILFYVLYDFVYFLGIIGMSRLSCNPFAIKSSTPTKSVADSTDNKGKVQEVFLIFITHLLNFYSLKTLNFVDSRPVIAPPVLKLDNAGISILIFFHSFDLLIFI